VTFSTVSFVAVLHGRAAHETMAAPSLWSPPVSLPSPDSTTPVTRASMAPSDAPASTVTPERSTGTWRVPDAPSAPLIHRLSIKQRAVFITIDDGNYRDARVLELISKTHLPVSLFLVNAAVNRGPSYWQSMARAGAKIEDHTLTHPRLTKMSYAGQRRQVCGPLGHYKALFGRRPTLFRPPYGAKNADTLRAVSACGLDAAVNWSATMGGGVIKTWANGKLRPGDIILMHFKPSLYDDLVKLMSVLRNERFSVGLLENYLTFTKRPAPARSSGRSPSPSPSPSPALAPLATPPASPPSSFMRQW
jgi:peptidoglycan/xylan/chitin deacetylase (PgdA/CDA1 family)